MRAWRLCCTRPSRRPRAARPVPDWAYVHKELRRKNVTLQLLWLEYREAHPDGYGYSQFCNLYRAWRRQVDVVMRQVHRAGEKLFVDFPGDTIPIWDPRRPGRCCCGPSCSSPWRGRPATCSPRRSPPRSCCTG